MSAVTHAASRASHAGWVKGDRPDRKRYPSPPKSLQTLEHTDDVIIVIICRYERTVKDAYIKLKKVAQQMGLTINQKKTTFMEVSNNKTKEKYIIVDNKNIEK
jgi:hypothetical protein